MLGDAERKVLAAVCDTVVPPIEHEPDPHGFWGRSASDMGVNQGVELLIDGIPDETLQAGLAELIDAIGAQGILRSPSQESREQILRNIALSGPEPAAGIAALIGMTLFITYGAPEAATGQNVNWKVLEYPGPLAAPPDEPKKLELHRPEGGETIEADVCIVGSGAGGSVIAATLAQRGLDVVVLDAAGYFNESDFAQLEFKAYQEMFWRGGPTPTADGNVSLVSGTTLGGGTTINWTNCLRTKPWVREQWAEHGLDDVKGEDFDRHLDAVWSRLGVTDSCSDLNGPQQRLAAGCEALGWSFKRITRNTDPDSYDPETAGFLGFGDQSGSKRSADRTWLADAQAEGARLIANCRATKLLLEGGRAAGVEAVYGWADLEGTPAEVTVRAPRVVVAAGALESPALLLRSGIGGPATGDYLRLHPTTAVAGVYGDDQQAWWGPPQAGLSDEFTNADGSGYGVLIETAQYAPGLIGSATPWTSGFDHKDRMTQFRFSAAFVGLTRDHGHGRVEIDAAGEAVPTYSVTDEVDLASFRTGIDAQVRLHEAAGAHTITPLAGGAPTWRRGDDLAAFINGAQRIPFRMGGHRLFSAHQMGTCRMGQDPATSVADPRGELHDTKGVWIGDASAFPTPSGTNPMISIMALSHRTAEAIADDAGAAAPSESKSDQEVTVGN